MKVIFVPVADRPECRIALKEAFQLAASLSSNVIGCHLRPHRAEQSSRRGWHLRLVVDGNDTAAAKGNQRGADMKHRAAKKLFVGLADKHEFDLIKRPRLGVEKSAQWVELVGDFDKLFSIVGPMADMSIVSRPKKSARGNSADFLLFALLEPGKPVLVLPQKTVANPGKRILIAWNQSVQAARAVSAALPLLQRAEAVHICSCGPENRVGPKSSSLSQYLTYWGIKSTRSTTSGKDAAKELMTTYKSTDSNLVVMGAYSRSRMRELLFGGVTQYMLFDASIPVFALHSG